MHSPQVMSENSLDRVIQSDISLALSSCPKDLLVEARPTRGCFKMSNECLGTYASEVCESTGTNNIKDIVDNLETYLLLFKLRYSEKRETAVKEKTHGIDCDCFGSSLCPSFSECRTSDSVSDELKHAILSPAATLVPQKLEEIEGRTSSENKFGNIERRLNLVKKAEGKGPLESFKRRVHATTTSDETASSVREHARNLSPHHSETSGRYTCSGFETKTSQPLSNL